MSLIRQDAKFLLVDDFEMARKVLRECLKRLGYTNISEAADGKAAYDLLCQAKKTGVPFDFVFSDVSLPGLDGPELFSACQKNPALADTPFVMISTEAEREQVSQAIRRGALDYITKPFSTRTIRAKILGATDKNRERPAA